MTFRLALAISIMIHSAAMLAWHGPRAPDIEPAKKKHPAEVEYVHVRAVETPRIELPNKVEMKPTSETAEARMRSSKDYVNYYSFIREKMRSCIKDRYRGRGKEGEVMIAFVLNADGSVASAAADRSHGGAQPELEAIALASLQDAAPFPAFPEALDSPQMSFALTIVFKRR